MPDTGMLSLVAAGEGGVRSNAFVSGGYLPPAVRGSVLEALIGIEDWYRTFCGLAGVDPTDERAAAAGLPPVEGYDLWPLLSGLNTTAPRTEVWLGSGGTGIESTDTATYVQVSVVSGPLALVTAF
jgi:hypothetical protein